MAGRLRSLRTRLARSDSATAQQAIDPCGVPATLTQDELDELLQRVAGLEDNIAQMRYVESRSVRRLFLLAKNVAKIIKANNVTMGEPVGNDAALFVLSNDSGKWLEMFVYPYKEMFILRDAAGVLSDMKFPFGNSAQGDLPRQSILMLNGYADFASRGSACESDAYWGDTVNSELTLVADEGIAA